MSVRTEYFRYGLLYRENLFWNYLQMLPPPRALWGQHPWEGASPNVPPSRVQQACGREGVGCEEERAILAWNRLH